MVQAGVVGLRANVLWTSAALVVILLLATSTVRAQPPSSAEPGQPSSAGPAPDGAEAQRREAKARYEQGAKAYREERYKDAIDLFLEADALSPSSALSFNIARAYDKIQDVKNALRWYRDYLRREPSADDRKQVEKVIHTHELALRDRGIQQVTVVSEPAGATLRVDGRPVGVTPWTGELAPGTHAFALVLGGYSDTQRAVELAADRALFVDVRLVPAPAAPPVASAPPAAAATAGPRDAAPSHTANPPPRDEARPAGVRPLSFVLLGAGAASLGVAGAFELARRGAEDDARQERTQVGYAAALDKMQSRQTLARVFAGVGGAALIAGAVSLAIDLGRGEEIVAVAGTCGGTDCWVAARGRF